MTTVNTAMAARGIRADVSGSIYGRMTDEFGALSIPGALIMNADPVSSEKRTYLLDGMRVTVTVEVERAAFA